LLLIYANGPFEIAHLIGSDHGLYSLPCLCIEEACGSKPLVNGIEALLFSALEISGQVADQLF